MIARLWAKLGLKAWNVFALVVVIGLVAGLCVLSRCNGEQGAVISQQRADAKTNVEVKRADTTASEQRVVDEVKLVKQEEELNDAIEATEDADRTRALRGCVILRQQGRDTSRIPGCR